MHNVMDILGTRWHLAMGNMANDGILRWEPHAHNGTLRWAILLTWGIHNEKHRHTMAPCDGQLGTHWHLAMGNMVCNGTVTWATWQEDAPRNGQLGNGTTRRVT